MTWDWNIYTLYRCSCSRIKSRPPAFSVHRASSKFRPFYHFERMSHDTLHRWKQTLRIN